MSSPKLPHHLYHETSTWDRFIQNRNKMRRPFQFIPEDSETASGDAIIDKKLYSRSEETYKHLIASAMSVYPSLQPWVSQWPIRSRNKPLLYSSGPSVVLDLPNIGYSVPTCNTVDWSATGLLTVAFPRSVYLWHSTTKRTVRLEGRGTSCLKWNPEGTAMFRASKNGTFRFLDIMANEDTTICSRSPCHLRCFITSCAFHPSAPLMYIGCSLGSVSAYHMNKCLHMITNIQEDNNEDFGVSRMGLSSDGRHLAVTALRMNFVFVYDTTNFEALYTITMSGPSFALAWHPWKRNLLVVSDNKGLMALYNMLGPMTPEATYIPAINSSIVNLTFNPHSAELVVSQNVYYGERNDELEFSGPSSVQLNVLSSFNRVVDRLEGHTASVQYLNWNPDGTQLSTAGCDETARIWDFLPHSVKQRMPMKVSCKLNEPKPNPVTTSIEIGRRMGLAIR